MAVYKNVLAGSLLAAATTLAGVNSVQADTWRYAFEEAMDEVQGKFAQKFKAEVEANSDHEIQLFPYGTLGESADIMEQTQAGILQFVDQSPGFTGALIPEAQVFFVPYLLPQDDEELFEFFRSSKAITEMFPELYAKQGLELLTMFPEGDVAITTREPVRSPEDFNEVKMRVMTNPLLVESYRRLARRRRRCLGARCMARFRQGSFRVRKIRPSISCPTSFMRSAIT